MEPLLIMALVLFEVALWQWRVAITVRGNSFGGALLGFVGALVQVTVIVQVVQDVGDVENIVAYASGVAIGVFVGCLLDVRLSTREVDRPGVRARRPGARPHAAVPRLAGHRDERRRAPGPGRRALPGDRPAHDRQVGRTSWACSPPRRAGRSRRSRRVGDCSARRSTRSCASDVRSGGGASDERRLLVEALVGPRADDRGLEVAPAAAAADRVVDAHRPRRGSGGCARPSRVVQSAMCSPSTCSLPRHSPWWWPSSPK